MMGCNCFVVKNTSTMPGDAPMKWVVSSDDSDYSMKAIQDTRKLMKAGDSLTVFFPTSGTIGMRTSGASVDAFKQHKQEKYEPLCDEFGVWPLLSCGPVLYQHVTSSFPWAPLSFRSLPIPLPLPLCSLLVHTPCS